MSDSLEAQGYMKGQPTAAYPMEIAFGSGDWVSTITDMEKWADAWMGSLLTQAEHSEVFPSPVQSEAAHFGAGWFTIQTQGTLVYYHGGDISGFTTLIALYPESEGVLIALSNQEGQRNILDAMIEVLAQEEF